MDEVVTKFEKHQQEIMDAAKDKLKKVCEDVLGEIYIDVAYYADQDANINYINKLREELAEEFMSEIKEKYTYYSWAHHMRMALLKESPEIISNKIIEDLRDKIKSLEDHIEQLRRNRY